MGIIENKPNFYLKKGRTYTAIQLGNMVKACLRSNGYAKQSWEFLNRFLDCKSQEEGWSVINEYVNVIKFNEK